MQPTIQLYDVDEDTFEKLAVEICRKLFGIGVQSFAKGKDGGRDGRFIGTATDFPSVSDPYSGKFIIQAKHTTTPAALLSASDFANKFDKEEVPRIKKLIENGELEHYFLFVNRRQGANWTVAFSDKVAALGCKTCTVVGEEDIQAHLRNSPEIVDVLGIAPSTDPFRVHPEELSEVIVAYHAEILSEDDESTTQDDFEYLPIARKNEVNGVTDGYDEFIQRDSLPHFDSISRFLKEPRNDALLSLYADTADELQQKAITYRKNFDSFDELLTFLHEKFTSQNQVLKSKKRYARLFLHYMYYHCDLGLHA